MQARKGHGRSGQDLADFGSPTFLASIVQDAADAIIGTTLDGIVTSWNRSAELVFGYTAEEMLGSSMDLLRPADTREEEVRLLQRLERGLRIDPFETVRLHKDGHEVDVSVAVSPVRDPEGTLIGLSEIARDIQALKRAQRELVQAKESAEAVSRELESFSYSVAHDLRSPLRSIDGFSQALLEDHQENLDEDGRRYLGYVRESAQLMGQLIDDMLTLSRVTLTDFAKEEVDLSGLAAAIVEGLRRDDADRQVEVHIDEELLAPGDPRMLMVLLSNLLANAWKFTSKRVGARIDFGATMRDGVPTYHVRDNGVGFDMDYVKKIFGIFQRLHSSRDFEGTGVGLAIVERIVQRHGGRVWAEGTVDGGASFFFTLGEREGTE